MKIHKQDKNKIFAFGISAFFFSSLLFTDAAISLIGDPGFLWYGVWRTSIGEFPMLDFQAYYPGRYFYSAIWFKIFGSQPLVLQRSVYFLQFFALSVYIWFLAENTQSKINTIIYGFLAFLWLIPWHKGYVHLVIMLGILIWYLYFKYQSKRTLLIAGFYTGNMFFWGLNYGVYAVFSAIMLIGISYYFRKDLQRSVLLFIFGFILGLIPMLLLLILQPEYAVEIVSKLLRIINYGSTNLTKSVPLPWDINLNWPILLILNSISLGIIFLLLPFIFLLIIIYLYRNYQYQSGSVLLLTVVGVFSVPYMHYIYSRAGLGHLGQGILPLVLGISLIILSKNKNSGLKILSGVSFIIVTGFATYPLNPLISGFISDHDDEQIYLDKPVRVRKAEGDLIKQTRTMITELDINKDKLYAIPNLAYLYVYTGMKAPVKEIFAILPMPKEDQFRIIESLKNKKIELIVFKNVKYDNKKEYSFEVTHQYIYDYIVKNYQIIKEYGDVKYFVLKSEIY